MVSLMLLVAMALATAAPTAPGECRYDTRVKVRVEKDTVVVEPTAAIVTPKAGVAWEIVGLPAGYSLEIDFRVQAGKKGPFVPGKARLRGRYVASGAGAIESSPSDQKDGVWKYDVVLRKGDVDVYAIDPSIIIRE
jgi:hypothetical protein